jgi:hypothetical protein
MCRWNVAIYKWKVHNEKIEIISFVVRFCLNRPHSLFIVVGQGMMQILQYLCYPLFSISMG